MQLRIWAEMVNSGLHLLMDESPNISMFQCAGGGITPSRKKKKSRKFYALKLQDVMNSL